MSATLCSHQAVTSLRCQVAKGSAVEQVLLDEVETPFDLALGLGAPRQAGPRLEAVVRGKGQKARIVQWPVLVVLQHHDLHVVVEADRGHAAKIREGADVLANRGGKVLRLDERQVRTPRVAQHIAEQVNSPPAFLGEIDVVGAVIHLGLLTHGRLEADHRRARGLHAQLPYPFTHHGVADGKAAGTQLLVHPHRRHVRVTLQQLHQEAFVLIEPARASRCLTQRRRRRLTRTFLLEAADHAADRAA